jgi:hypothetical protein
MAIQTDYINARMNTVWPSIGTPANVNYPDLVNLFINYNEDLADAIEDGYGLGQTSLADTIATYVTSTIASDIDGSDVNRLTNMLDGTNVTGPDTEAPGSTTNKDYVTLSQWQTAVGATLGLTDPGFNIGYTIPNSQMRVDVAPGTNTFGVFDYVPSTLSSVVSGIYFPSLFNATYLRDFGSAGTDTIDLDNPIGQVDSPEYGDRIRFIFLNTTNDGGIQAPIRKINGYSEKITFGQAYDYAIYDLVYTSNANTGWLFKNVITGPLL